MHFSNAQDLNDFLMILGQGKVLDCATLFSKEVFDRDLINAKINRAEALNMQQKFIEGIHIFAAIMKDKLGDMQTSETLLAIKSAKAARNAAVNKALSRPITSLYRLFTKPQGKMVDASRNSDLPSTRFPDDNNSLHSDAKSNKTL